jgi:hypothetical protein
MEFAFSFATPAQPFVGETLREWLWDVKTAAIAPMNGPPQARAPAPEPASGFMASGLGRRSFIALVSFILFFSHIFSDRSFESLGNSFLFQEY